MLFASDGSLVSLLGFGFNQTGQESRMAKDFSIDATRLKIISLERFVICLKLKMCVVTLFMKLFDSKIKGYCLGSWHCLFIIGPGPRKGTILNVLHIDSADSVVGTGFGSYYFFFCGDMIRVSQAGHQHLLELPKRCSYQPYSRRPR